MLNELALFNISNSCFFSNYLPILIFIVISFILVVGLLTASYTITPQLPYTNKVKQYECGFDSISDSRKLFNIKFYLVAIIFVIFDVEIAFLYPWALVVKEITLAGFWSAIIFIAVLVLGFVYELKKGVLEWY
ncbi:UNVERIFIED_CONTAM: hypothetical protein PYX00_011172 [Menopon gallinae]|uniref:NADH-ubiquinone oxidoreductase chain 3 n=1 Tax=Menopon gallinae TaxID=328185 RepID=A0AAW2H6C7_9NEOP